MVADQPGSAMTDLERARGGDQRAFGSLLRAEDGGCRALAYRILRDRDAMDDALQDAYLKAWRKLDGFRGESGFGSWLYRIVYTTCLDHVRRRRPTEPLDDRLPPSPSAGPAAAAEARVTLDRALAELSVEHRAMLVLIDGIGLPYAEAAEVLGLKEGTVASRLHHARIAMRRAIGDDAIDEEPTDPREGEAR